MERLMKDLLRAADRRDFLCRNVPRCPKCRSEQIQLIGRLKPAQWRCRICQHRFEQEPSHKKVAGT
jgi:hypothetical protein